MPRGSRTLLAALVLAASATVLTGCSGDGHTDADVTFVDQMVPHHRQAVEMVDLVDPRVVTPAFRDLAEGIRDAQRPEIDEMTGWLESWGEMVPEAGSTAGSGMDMGEMDGMMSADEMTSLETAPDSTFEQQWLTLMIEHHRGALAMARTEIEDGENDDAVALAKRIVATQTDEIDQMQALL